MPNWLFNPGGQNVSLGGLFRHMGEIEQSYIRLPSKYFEQDFSYRSPDPTIETSIVQLKSWFQNLDETFKTTLSAIPDADAEKMIERPSGNTIPPGLQVDVYVQAMMIFFGKTVVYFRAMNKALPPSVEEYVA